MAFGDFATMAFLYKYKYGRLIFHEMGDDLDGRWKFDELSEKYSLEKQFTDTNVNLDNHKNFTRDVDHLDR